MQYAVNGSILDLIHKEKRLTEARSCQLFRQILAGIEYCHSQQVCHRDIKCENILLDENFDVKLIDFGFAKCYKQAPKSPGQEKLEAAIAGSSNGAGTSSGSSSSKASATKKKEKNPDFSETYCGSYAYASPEILKGIPYDPYLSDVWAMGVVLYAMVFGRLPFDDRDAAKLIKARFEILELSHRKLTFFPPQQVQQPVSFPSSVEASDNVKACIRKILSPLKSRYSVADLNNDVWVSTAHTDQPVSVSGRKLSTR